MNISDVISKINNGLANKDFKILYQNVEISRKRYVKACNKFLDVFSDRDNIRIFSAPGRTEIGGNHTDHQHGRVLAGSVDLDIIGVVSANNDGIVRIKSEGFPMDEINLSELEINKSEQGRASALIRGVCNYFKESGYNIGGFDAYTTSNVMRGSGLSSSAAFEVFIGTVLNFMFNDGLINPVEIAKISQKAESIYFGKPCGLLDQSASALGGFTAIDFNDPNNPIVENINYNLSEQNYALCVVNTGGNHANLTQDYADITIECKNISKYFNKEFLRDVNVEDFYNCIPKLRAKFGDRAVLRAIHFFNEDLRAEDEKNALKSNDFLKFLRLVQESGESSFRFLQNVYSNSNVSEQGISLGIALTEQFLHNTGKGAYRVHGGGFAGTILCFLPTDMINDYKNYIEGFFGEASCYVLKIRSVGGFELIL